MTLNGSGNNSNVRLVLTTYPLVTLYYASYYIIAKSRDYFKAVLSHVYVKYVLLPLILSVLAYSSVIMPSPKEVIFHYSDTNTDSLLSIHEYAAAINITLMHSINPEDIASSWMNYYAKNNKSMNLASILFKKEDFVGWFEDPSTPLELRPTHQFPQHWLKEVEMFTADIIWWLLLGIMSSIGFGTGIHTGILFLFPHIYKVTSAASTCRNLNFYTYPTNPILTSESTFKGFFQFYQPTWPFLNITAIMAKDTVRVYKCIDPSNHSSQISIWSITCKVIFFAVIWGVGTALGEIPPYWLSYKAAKKGDGSSNIRNLAKHSNRIIAIFMGWMITAIEHYGFWAVLLLASWPNATFDMCGMACGQFLLPFSVFLSATIIGKGIIKILLQTLFMVTLFSRTYITDFISAVGYGINQALPSKWSISSYIELLIMYVDKTKDIVMKQSIKNKTTELHRFHTVNSPVNDNTMYLELVMKLIISLAICIFLKSIIEQFANSQYEIEKSKKKSKRGKSKNRH